VGFPHSTQAEPAFLSEISQEAVKRGASRVVVYDTNGSADPFEVHDLIKRLKESLKTPVFFHGHNDLGLATANSLALFMPAPTCGCHDERPRRQSRKCFPRTGGDDPAPERLSHRRIHRVLRGVSQTVEEISGVPVWRLAPIVGEYVATHKSPGHLEIPELFEAFDPSLVGLSRRTER